MNGSLQEEFVKRAMLSSTFLQFLLGDWVKRMTTREACFPPSMFEWEPNPVIIPHLRGGRLQSLDSGSSTAKDTSDRHLVEIVGEAEELSPDMAVAFDDKGAVKRNSMSPVAPRYTGLTTMSPFYLLLHALNAHTSQRERLNSSMQ
jgi:hypothetical protein